MTDVQKELGTAWFMYIILYKQLRDEIMRMFFESSASYFALQVVILKYK